MNKYEEICLRIFLHYFLIKITRINQNLLQSVRIYSFSRNEILASRHEKSIFKDSAHLANYSRKISNLEFSFHYY